MRVLVTGAGGFLGGHVVRALLSEGAAPIAGIRDRDPGERLKCERVRVSLEEKPSIVAALAEAKPEVIVNCAAYGVDHRQQDLATAIAVNVLGTLQLYVAAREAGIERFVSVGTSFEYGSHPGWISETAPLLPVGTYGASKAAATTMLLERGRGLGCAPVIARPFSMYGPGEGRHKLAPQIVEASRNGDELALSQGNEMRDYLPVGDVARALASLACLATERFPFGQVFNICSGRAVSIRSFAEAIASAAGGRAILRFGALPSRAGVPLSSVGDPTRWRSFCQANGLDGALVETPMKDAVAAMLAEDPACVS